MEGRSRQCSPSRCAPRRVLVALAVILGVAHAAAADVDKPFQALDVLAGVRPDEITCAPPDYVQVTVHDRADCIRAYVGGAAFAATPIVLLEGDAVSTGDRGGIEVWRGYERLTPATMQREVEQYAAATARPFVNLARPGTYGSSGEHLQRRREREVALVDAALDALKRRHGWTVLDLVGQSGGGHLVAALLARRADIGCAVVASGVTAVRRRYEAAGRTSDMTGYTDPVDPIDHVRDAARHPPKRVIVLTDPQDRTVAADLQGAYVEALREAGVSVEQRFVSAADRAHHNLRRPAIAAAFACRP